jgi:hypothetical protein
VVLAPSAIRKPGEAADILRSLVDRIELRQQEKLEIDLYGDLAGILTLAGKKDRPLDQNDQSVQQVKVVRGLATTFTERECKGGLVRTRAPPWQEGSVVQSHPAPPGNADHTDAEHNATLISFCINFGDVTSIDDLIARLEDSKALRERGLAVG